MAQKYNYPMSDLTKKIGQREVIMNIWLAFYPGAKIGVLCRNGSGKSTLRLVDLRITSMYNEHHVETVDCQIVVYGSEGFREERIRSF
jgi:ATPase subunit of ABC transporter with duplicated ATPase domains